MEDLEPGPTPILDLGKRLTATAALAQAAKDHAGEVAVEATTDGQVELAVSGTKGRLSGTGYVRSALGTVKGLVAGVRGAE
jgi:hypothetical protein